MKYSKDVVPNFNSTPILRKKSSCTFSGFKLEKKAGPTSCTLGCDNLTPKERANAHFPRKLPQGQRKAPGLSEQSLPKPKQRKSLRFKYIRSRVRKYQKIIYLVLEQPRSSLLGKLVFILLMIGIIFSTCEGIFITSETTFFNPVILLVDKVISGLFVLEFFLRIASSTAFGGKIRQIFKNPIFLIDIIAIIPILIEIQYLQRGIVDLKLISLCKSLTILKTLRYIKNVSLLIQGFKKSLSSLCFLLLAIIITTFVFGTLMYYAETLNPESSFNHGIPTSLWWAIVTMTTVGYGDIISTTALGKIIASILGIIGMLMIALPLVILGYHFQEAYNEVEEERMIEKVKENQLQGKENLEQREKEAFFLKRRIEGIEEYNKKITNLLVDSGSIYKNVSKDLKRLFKTMYADNDLDQLKQQQSFKTKIELMEKLSRTKRKIKLINLFKGGIGNPSKDELSPTFPKNQGNSHEKDLDPVLKQDSLFNIKHLHPIEKDEESFAISLFNSLSEFSNLDNVLGGDSSSFVGKVARFTHKSGFPTQSIDSKDEPLKIYQSHIPKTKREKYKNSSKLVNNSFHVIERDARNPLCFESTLGGTTSPLDLSASRSPVG